MSGYIDYNKLPNNYYDFIALLKAYEVPEEIEKEAIVGWVKFHKLNMRIINSKQKGYVGQKS